MDSTHAGIADIAPAGSPSARLPIARSIDIAEGRAANDPGPSARTATSRTHPQAPDTEQSVCETAWRAYREVALVCGTTTPCAAELRAALEWYVEQLLETADVRIACLVGEAGLVMPAKAFLAFARATDPQLDVALRALAACDQVVARPNHAHPRVSVEKTRKG